MNSKIIGIAILVVAIVGASAYFLTKNDTSDTFTKSLYQNEKIGLVINTINPPESIDDIEKSYKIAATSGVGRTNLYVHWDSLEPEKGNFDWRVSDIMMKLNEKYNFKTTLFFSVINADRLGPFPLWMGNQVLGKSLENDTTRVLDAILTRYPNIDYVIFAGDIDYHFQRASASIPAYVEFFENISLEIKSNHPNVKIGNSISLENVVKKALFPGGSFELTPQLEMGDFIAFSYKPTDIVGDIDLTTQATDIDLIDNNSSAISFDTTGKAGILEVVTTNGAERVNLSGGAIIQGHVTASGGISGSHGHFNEIKQNTTKNN